MLAPTLPDLSKLDREALQALLLAEHRERMATHQRLLSRESEIAHLKLLLSQLRRMQFGRKSEKLERQIEQLELRLEDLQQAEPAEDVPPVEGSSSEPSPDTSAAKAKRRRALPEHLPRKTQTHVPKHSACPDCGGELRKLGEDISEVLEYVPACFEVIRHVRPKLSCRCCERIVQAPAPSRPIARGLAGPGLLAHVLISKYADHSGWAVRTGDGNVDLRLPEDFSMDLDVQSGDGNVRLEFPLAMVGGGQQSRVRGPINGGGQHLEVHSDKGNIMVRKTSGSV